MTSGISATGSTDTFETMGASRQGAYIQRLATLTNQSLDEASSTMEKIVRARARTAALPALKASGELKPIAMELKSGPANEKYERPQISAAAAKSYEEMSQPYQQPDNHAVGALNVDYVVKTAEARDVSADSYLESLRDTMASAPKDTVFTGAWGNDRVTNSLDEYASWIKAAESANAVAKYQQIASAG